MTVIKINPDLARITVNGIQLIQACSFKNKKGFTSPVMTPETDKHGDPIFALPGGGRAGLDDLLKKRNVT